MATWSLFAPGCGGFDGDRGPSTPARAEGPTTRRLSVDTHHRQAALYRLLGDRHAMHIDPAAARAAGMPRPFLHGLCSLAATTLALARRLGTHPAELLELEARFTAPVFPGDSLDVSVLADPGADSEARFEATTEGRRALSGGRARFRSAPPTDGHPIQEENPDA
ncbi:MaoC/PaaZ C-terminal domain-containing protein [Streptomyces sp. B-S-A12]|uniref:MaoC/PaaZ C-terminal domain-containing protein n=1 Tax=Streptomyces luteolus TaxID=3043615 RepID=A0ABT6T481_9ACTN|nr:MaoC/PaaZ C-terminal domain-containing protein [Streptomyces sp. B-S-A12]MDI3422198.1 MaoC/PaaZ C-terminal domain-containing protein [Streptomyces sp. B-S-A12]